MTTQRETPVHVPTTEGDARFDRLMGRAWGALFAVLAGAVVAAGAMVATARQPIVINTATEHKAMGAGPVAYSKSFSVTSSATTVLQYDPDFQHASGQCVNETAGVGVFIVDPSATVTTDGTGPFCDTCKGGAVFAIGGKDSVRGAGSATVRCRFYSQPVSLGTSGGGGGGGGTFTGGTLTSGLNLDDTNDLCSETLAQAYANDLNTGRQRLGADADQMCVGGKRASLVTLAPTPSVIGQGITTLGTDAGASLDLNAVDGAYNTTCLGGEACTSNTKGFQNTALGSRALYSNVDGDENTALGQGALYWNTVSGNLGCGFHAGLNHTTGTGNAFVGTQAGEGGDSASTVTSNNTGVGYWALKSIRSSATGANTATGHQAGVNVSTGFMNSLFGFKAGEALTTGAQNTCGGREACSDLTTQSFNTAWGSQAAIALTGSETTCIGTGACLVATSSDQSTMVGMFAGYTATPANAITTGDTVTFLGAYSGYANTTQSANATAVGFGALVDAANHMQLGNASVTEVKTEGALRSGTLGTLVLDPQTTALGTCSATSGLAGKIRSYRKGSGGTEATSICACEEVAGVYAWTAFTATGDCT